MTSLWQQKKANKGKLTGSQEPHSVAVNITQKLLEIMCYLSKAFANTFLLPRLQKSWLSLSILHCFIILLKRTQRETGLALFPYSRPKSCFKSLFFKKIINDKTVLKSSTIPSNSGPFLSPPFPNRDQVLVRRIRFQGESSSQMR